MRLKTAVENIQNCCQCKIIRNVKVIIHTILINPASWFGITYDISHNVIGLISVNSNE
jgi:hypothetical protein